MKNKNKKGFTIVELIIVIAVIAILASILIPTFANLISKANMTADNVLVTTLNEHLAIEEITEGKNQTMFDALKDAEEAGYLIKSLNSKSNNDIVWDQDTDRFVMINKQGTKILSGETNNLNKKYRLWKISNQIETEYSTYYTGDLKIISTSKGFDVGNIEDITKITYTNNGATAYAQEVKIRTNSASIELVVNGYVSADGNTCDTIYHYGLLGDLDIIKCGNNSFHTFDTIGFVKVTSGRFVADKNAHIHTAYAATNQAIIDKVDSAIIENSYAAEESFAEENSKGNVILNYDSTKTEQNIKQEAIAAVTPDPYAKIIANAPGFANYAIVGADGVVYGYDWPEFISGDNPNQQYTYLLLKDSVCEYTVVTSDIVIDLNGHVLTLTTDGIGGFGQALNLIIKGDKEGSKIVGPSSASIIAASGRVNIISGYFDISLGYFADMGVTIAPKNIYITGGTFSKTNPNNCTIPEGYHAVNNGDGTWTVTKN